MIKSFSTSLWYIMPAIVIITFVICSCRQNSPELKISGAEYYPRWLMNDIYHTDQTSGIAFLTESDDGVLQFLLADDIGKIHRFFISRDTIFSFSEIKFGSEVIENFADFPKLDFEEIFFDKYSGEVFLSLEGNGENHLLYHGIYKLKFKNSDIYQDSVLSFEKLIFQPQEMFNANLNPNIGYEGFTADENYFYLGLENVQTADGNFSEHTMLRIADKKTFKIIKEISTDSIGITTICGLYSDENYSLWGIDRNNKIVFKLVLDEYFSVTEKSFFEVKTVIPRYNNFEYVGSPESVTIASDKFLFMPDDPWHKFFIPPDEILNQVDTATANNFNNFIPIIYKFEIK